MDGPTAVTLKVYCSNKGISKYPGAQQGQGVIRLNPVTSGSEENKQFFAATPSGNLEFSTVNERAAGFFEPGEEYVVTITKIVVEA